MIAWAVNFCLGSIFYLLMTTLAVYAVGRFGVSDAAGGFAASVFVLGATAARLFAGNVVDLVGGRRILIGALAVVVLVSLGYFAVDGYRWLLLVRGVHGICFGLASTATMALAQAAIPRSRHAEGTGYFTLSTTLSTALGPLLALMVVADHGYDALFGLATGVAVAATVLGIFIAGPQHRLDPETRARLRRFRPADLLHPRVLPVSLFMTVMAICYSGVLSFLHSYAGQEGLEAGAGAFFIAYAVVLLVARLMAGRIQDRRGANPVVYVSIVSFAVGLGALALAGADAVVVASGCLIGLGFGTLMSAMQAVAIARVPPQRIGVAVSTHYFMVDLGIGLGPVLLGLLVAQVGFAAMYGVLAGVVLLGAGLYHLVHGRTERTTV